jgi:hypothetical protein
MLTTLTKRATTRHLTRCQVRCHVGHGNPDLLSTPPETPSGPREYPDLGLVAVKASQNILRLLESSQVGFQYADFSTVWHPRSLTWRHNGTEWKASTVKEELENQRKSLTSSRLVSLSVSDERTALAKMIGVDGRQRYVSMLRLDPPEEAKQMGMSPMVANDGWHIVRELIAGPAAAIPVVPTEAFASIGQTLQDYLSIEHGGGMKDAKKAEQLFSSQASLLAVGIAPMEEAPTDWSAPSGILLEIPLNTYLGGVESQSPHSTESKQHDAVLHIDVLPCQTAAVAAVHVGNGAQTHMYEDHLLLGRSATHSNDWRILSKIFTPKKWPHAKN